MKRKTTVNITTRRRDLKVESTATKRDIKRVRRPLDITKRPTKMITIRNTSSTIAKRRKAIIRNMEASTSSMRPRKVNTRRAKIINLAKRKDIKVRFFPSLIKYL